MVVFLSFVQAQENNQLESNSTWEINNKKENKKIKVKGFIRISDDDRRIAELSNDAAINYSTGARKLEVSRDRQGNVQYKIDGELKTAFSPAEESFLQASIKDLINQGLDAKARARRIYAKNGIEGLLQEVKGLPSDFPKSLYLKSILAMDVVASETTQLLGYASESLKSDYYKSEILNEVTAKSLQNNQVLNAYLQGAASIGSDYYQYTCLNRLINEVPISKAQQTQAIQVAQQIKSDYYQAELLKNIFAKQSPDAEGYHEALKLLTALKSDYYKSEVLSKLAHAELKEADWKLLIAQLGAIHSDYYKSEVLQKFIAKAPRTDSIKIELTAAAKGIKSETYYGKTMRKITDL